MFESSNFFKSINCPYYSSSSNTNTCERPYCQFKHPNLNKTDQQQPQQATTSNSTKSQQTASSSNNEPLNKLPDALANLSEALKKVQELFGSNEANKSGSKEKSLTEKLSGDGQLNKIDNGLVEKLNDISSIILSKAAEATSSTSAETGSPKTSKSAKNVYKVSKLAPEYSPTPLNELKKIKQTQEDVKNVNNGLKRKPSMNNLDEDEARSAASDTDSGFNEAKIRKDDLIPVKKVKTEQNSQENDESKPKVDMASFAKLKPCQQLLMRYQLLNKPAPTAASLNDAKLKKKTQNLTQQPGDSAKKSTDKTVPHLILDSTTSSTKVPLVMRQRYLKFIFDNGKSSFATIEKACEKAAEQEKSIYDRAKNKNIYTNLAANLIKSLRTQQTLSKPPSTAHASSTHLVKTQQVCTYSHEALLSGPKASRVSYSINRVKQIEIKDLTVSQVYQLFNKYVLNEKQLDENSFPKWMESNEKKRLAYIPNYSAQNKNISSASGTKDKAKDATNEKGDNTAKDKQSTSVASDKESLLTKKCKRCNRTFHLISKTMVYSTNNSTCVYHWGKLRNVRVNKALEQKYSCCSGGINEEGCMFGKHVYDGDYDGNGIGSNIDGYVETSESSQKSNSDSKVSTNIYALDCEMCYTTKGLELARVSIVDINEKEIYESLVKPDYEILDYNTRWSGLTEESLKDCNKKLKQVQSDLLKLFNKDTILIGHSLDSDFKALKLIHRNVIDTTVVFPHKMGPPYKRALRNLMSEHLQKIIQEDAEGHDSKEDANACVQLMIWKISEDLKLKKTTISEMHPKTTSASFSSAASPVKTITATKVVNSSSVITKKVVGNNNNNSSQSILSKHLSLQIAKTKTLSSNLN